MTTHQVKQSSRDGFYPPPGFRSTNTRHGTSGQTRGGVYLAERLVTDQMISVKLEFEIYIFSHPHMGGPQQEVCDPKLQGEHEVAFHISYIESNDADLLGSGAAHLST